MDVSFGGVTNASFDHGIVLPDTIPNRTQDLEIAKRFLDAFGVGRGDDVVWVSPPINMQLTRQTLLRGANIFSYDLHGDFQESLKAAYEAMEEPKGAATFFNSDFSKGSLPERAKLVLISNVFDAPKRMAPDEATARAIVARACQLTAGFGNIAQSYLHPERIKELNKKTMVYGFDAGFALTPSVTEIVEASRFGGRMAYGFTSKRM